MHQSVCLIYDTSYAFIQQKRGGVIAGLYCSCCIHERAEGNWGQIVWVSFSNFLLLTYVDDPCLFFSQFSCHFRRRRSTRLPCERKQTPITFGTRCTSRPGCWGRGLLHDASCCQSFCSTSAAACRICSFRALLALVCKFIEVNGVSVCFRC